MLREKMSGLGGRFSSGGHLPTAILNVSKWKLNYSNRFSVGRKLILG